VPPEGGGTEIELWELPPPQATKNAARKTISESATNRARAVAIEQTPLKRSNMFCAPRSGKFDLG
jgi:hypothetical protein